MEITASAPPTGGRRAPPPMHSPGMPVLGSTLAFFRNPLGVHLEAFRRHGPAYRIRVLGRTVTVLAGVEANRFIWENDALWDYGTASAIFRDNFDDTYLTQLDGERHAKKRRRMQAGFRPQALAALTPIMSEAQLNELKSVEGQTVDLRELCSRIIVCMSSRALLQVRLPEGLDRVIAVVEHNLLFGARLPRWMHAWWYGRRSYQEKRRELLGYIERMIDERAGRPGDGDDVLAITIRNHPSTEPPLTRQEIVFDAALLFLAGTNSTSSVIIWAILLVHSRPDWLAQLRTELRNWDPAAFRGMADYPLLKATILETERLRPSIPFARRASKSEFSFGGYDFAPGTTFLHATFVPHFQEQHYDKPLEFLPERFLENRNPQPRVHGLFGGGSHVCLGQPLARVQEPLVLANFIRYYDLVFPGPLPLAPRLSSVLTPAVDRLPVRIVRRREDAA
jgi:cytochrome P450